MKNRPKARILRIKSMGSELVSLNIMTESVGSEVKSLTDRWATLEEKVSAIKSNFFKLLARVSDYSFTVRLFFKTVHLSHCVYHISVSFPVGLETRSLT